MENRSVREIIGTLRSGWLVILAAAIVVGLLALGGSLLETPQYTSTSTLYVTSGSDDNSQSAYQGSLASQQRVMSYAKLVGSDAVVSAALQQSGLQISESAAKSALSASATTDTVLLNVTATSTDPNQAAALANAVSNSMVTYILRLETPTGGGQPLAKLTVVTPASPGKSPVSPKTRRNVMLGIVLGLLLGGAGVLGFTRLSVKVRNERDLTHVLSAPVLAAVPADRSLKDESVLDFGTGATPAAEGFRKLRTSLSFVSIDNPPRVILVTSAMASEGKTTTAINLAAALAESGSSAILVDADLRKPQVATRLGINGDIGLTSWLRGDGDLGDLVQSTSIDGLTALACGAQPPNPAELLEAQRVGDGLRQLAQKYDFVIVDSAPVLPVADTVSLSRWVDGSILVAKAGESKYPQLRAAADQLSVSGTPLLGTVLAAVNAHGSYGYSYYGYGYGYGNKPASESSKPADAPATQRPAAPVVKPPVVAESHHDEPGHSQVPAQAAPVTAAATAKSWSVVRMGESSAVSANGSDPGPSNSGFHRMQDE